MARTPRKAEITPAPEINIEAFNKEASAGVILEQMTEGYSEGRDLLNQLIGQAQMADAFAKFSLTVSTFKLAYIKENKLYRELKGKKTADGQHFSGTWDEFCTFIGKSRQQIDEDIQNFKILGGDAFDSLSKMGVGYRELRQLRRLPEDQKNALIEIAKTGDKEAVLEYAEDVISRQEKEKESIKADYDALSAVATEKTEEIETLKLENEKLKHIIQNATPDEKVEKLRAELSSLAYQCHKNIAAGFGEGCGLLEELGDDYKGHVSALLRHLEISIAQLRDLFAIPQLTDPDQLPPWAAIMGVDDSTDEEPATE